jgi:hypothetical protein
MKRARVCQPRKTPSKTAPSATDKSIYFLFQTPSDSEKVATFAGRYESALLHRLDGIAMADRGRISSLSFQSQ